MKRKILRVYDSDAYNEIYYIKSFKDDRHNYIFKADNLEEYTFPKTL